jgi:hypothetical protein
MATAALISPSTPYHGHPPPFSSGYHHPSQGVTIAGMISPVEPRRASDDSETSHRQSLPSISDVLSGAKPSVYPPSSAPTSMSGSSFPSPYASAPPPRSSYPEEKRSSPRSIHSSSSYPSGREPLPAFSEPARPPPFAARPPPLSNFSGPHPSPPIKGELEEKASETHQLNGAYTHPHVPPQPHPYPPGQLPPGQHPLPAYPVSPRHPGPPGPPLPSPFEAGRPPLHGEEGEYPRPRYDATLNRAFEAWGYQESLTKVSDLSTTGLVRLKLRLMSSPRSHRHLEPSTTSPRRMRGLLRNSMVLTPSRRGYRRREKFPTCLDAPITSRSRWRVCGTLCCKMSSTSEREKAARERDHTTTRMWPCTATE